MFKTSKVEGFNCPNKVIILRKDIPIIVANSMTQANMFISYLNGNDNIVIRDDLKRRLNKFRRI